MTTRVYQYGAVPTSQYPEEAINELWRSNRLWNALVEIHNKNFERWTEARCQADAQYKALHEQVKALEDEICAARDAKRSARQKAGTSRDASHPLIAAEQTVINDLITRKKKVEKEAKAARKQADDKIDTKAMNDDFKQKIKAAKRVENTDGLDSNTANEVGQHFKKARQAVFKKPNARLRFHRFDGTGYRHYRFRASGATHDGVELATLFSQGEDDNRPFVLNTGVSRRGVPRWKLRVKVAGGATTASKVYAEFDIVVHRPMPDGAWINNAKLMRRRVGDRFRYTVNFSVRVPDGAPRSPGMGAIGVDIGFRCLPDGTMRAGTIVVSNDGADSPEHVVLPKEYVTRMQHKEALQSRLDRSATELGQKIRPWLKKGSVLPEDHKKYRLVRAVVRMPDEKTLSFEQAYKMAAWFVCKEPGTLSPDVEDALKAWWETYRDLYREMHNLYAKLLARRREQYRIIAARLVGYGVPIGIEAIDLTTFAETRDVENALSNRARYQRFLVSNSEFIGAIKNAADREGVRVEKIPAPNTSRRCSGCGTVNKELRSEIKWQCPSCRMTHDRDENAAKNIANEAKKKAKKRMSCIEIQAVAE